MLTHGLKDDEIGRLDAALFEGAVDADWQAPDVLTVAEG